MFTANMNKVIQAISLIALLVLLYSIYQPENVYLQSAISWYVLLIIFRVIWVGAYFSYNVGSMPGLVAETPLEKIRRLEKAVAFKGLANISLRVIILLMTVLTLFSMGHLLIPLLLIVTFILHYIVDQDAAMRIELMRV